MIERKIPVTAQTFKGRMNGIEEDVVCRMLIPIFEDHNRQVVALIGKEVYQEPEKDYPYLRG